MINISNCPITGLKRKVTKKRLNWYEDTRQVIIKCFISHYDSNDNLIENSRIKSYTRELTASDSLVNPNTGVLLTNQQLEDYKNNVNLGFTPIEEYDFYEMMSNAPIVIKQMLENIIMLRDSEDKFNI